MMFAILRLARYVCRLLAIIILSIPVAVAFSALALIISWVYFPAYSASIDIRELNTKVILNFYYTWSNEDSGREINMKTRHGFVKTKICGYDWAHHSRTNIYTTPGGRIAVVGPDCCDLIFDPVALTSSPATNVSSDGWAYIGGFFLINGLLGFFSPDRLPECIERRCDPPASDRNVRNANRQDACLTPLPIK